jgi:hypothetical protein
MWCYGSGEFRWSFSVALNMWTSNNFIAMCDADGHGELIGNCLTLGYIMLCHYLWRWLLTSCLEDWLKKLCLFVVDIIDYFGCDYKMCYFTCAQGSTFKNVVIEGMRWSNMEGPCAQLCTMSSFQCGWPNWPFFSCRNPTLKEVWSRHSHSWKWEFGVLRDSQKLRRQLQGSKNLALRCSLYRWKGLEV